MRVKICGITQAAQGRAIAGWGATALGFICVPASPRYLTPALIQAITAQLPTGIDRIGVFANPAVAEIQATVAIAGLNGVQLHGQESPEFCQQVRQALPGMELIKALRIRNQEDLANSQPYQAVVDTLLLDAYDPQHLGGTGKTLNWQMLSTFHPGCPWFLAGGLTPDNILQALAQVQPDGIDLSSGLESSPGIKDLTKAQRLFEQLNQLIPESANTRIS